MFKHIDMNAIMYINAIAIYDLLFLSLDPLLILENPK